MELFLVPNDIENTVLVAEFKDPGPSNSRTMTTPINLNHGNFQDDIGGYVHPRGHRHPYAHACPPSRHGVHGPGQHDGVYYDPYNYSPNTGYHWHDHTNDDASSSDSEGTIPVGLYQIGTTKILDGIRTSRIQRLGPVAQTKQESVIAEIQWKTWGTPTTVKSAHISRVHRSDYHSLRIANRKGRAVGGGGDRNGDGDSGEDTSNAGLGRGWTGSRKRGGGNVPRTKWKGKARAGPIRDVEKVKASVILYNKSKFSSSNSRYFIGDDGHEYRWKMLRSAGCVLTRTDTGEEMARYTYVVISEGLFAGERKTVLRILPNCSLDLDLLVLTFVLMEKKRRDGLGDQTKQGPHDEEVQGDGGGSGGEA
ncbi:hypothetical protein AX16_002931 [Volvariella volvacea WC 439]|nr:hypothetical protein AX16_002931 [Volvariella volvacea WC 439]